MSALSDYLENKLADHGVGTTTYTPAATLTVKLYTAAPSDTGGGTEVTGGNYAAVALTNNTTNFPECVVGDTAIKSNGTVIQFPQASASWGTVTHWAIYAGADMLAWGPVAPTNVVSSGDAPKFAIGSLTIQLLNSLAGGFSASVRRKLLDLAFGGVVYAKPVAVYAGVGTSISGENPTEWDDSGYNRAAVAFTAASAGAAVSSTSGGPVLASSVNAGGDTLTHYGLWDDLASGSLIASGPLSTPRSPAALDTLRFNTGAIVLTMQ
jgi:hypothetical protein